MPHHGSNSSSTQSFIQTVDPEISIISVGYRNRYKLPSNLVLARYAHATRKVIQTDKSGAITIKLDGDEGMLIETYRQAALRYWHHRPN